MNRLALSIIASFALACASTPKTKPIASTGPAASEMAPTPAPAPAPVATTESESKRPAAKAIPGDARDAFDRAIQAGLRRDVLQAEQQLKVALEKDPKLDYGWTDLGVLYEREALPDKAEQSYRHALEINPDQDAAWSYLTRLICRRRHSKQIEAELREVMQKRPDSIGARNALVFVLIYHDKLAEAADEAKKVLKLDERNVRAMQLLSQVYYRQGKYELCKMVLENAHAVQPKDPATLNALGLVNLQLKAKPAALDFFRQAAEAQPDFAEAKNNYGALLNESQDYESAAKVLEDAVTAAPEFAGARLNLGNAYRGKQDFTKAIAQYKQALNLKPDAKDAFFNLGILHLDSEVPNLDPVDRLKTAIAYFQQYREKGGQDERVDQYVKDANKGIEKELRRRERERKDQLRNAASPAPAKPATAEAESSPDATPAAEEAAPRPSQKSAERVGKKSKSKKPPPEGK